MPYGTSRYGVSVYEAPAAPPPAPGGGGGGLDGKVVLERATVHIRHIRRRQPGETGGVQVLGDWYVAQPPKGVNGEQGWQSGVYEPHEGEEGTFALSFPNSNGADGILHRRRFLCLTSNDFREGDEFIEVYEGDPPGGRLLWVGVITGGSKRRSSVELRGSCGLRLLKHVRETRAGFWTGHAPRDVWERYTQAWRSVIADDFADPGFTYSASEQITADGRWRHVRVENSGSAARMRIEAAGTQAYLYAGSAYAIPIGRFTANSSDWRVETQVTRPRLPSGAHVRLSMVTEDGGVFAEIDLGGIQAIAVAGLSAAPFAYELGPGTNHLAIEGRGRWIYYYADGALKMVMPTPFLNRGLHLPAVRADSGTGASLMVTVHSLQLRRTRPLLMRGADKGDYRLPGEPTPGGLVGAYYSETDTYSRFGSESHNHLLKPTKEPSARRVDPAINFPVGEGSGGT